MAMIGVTYYKFEIELQVSFRAYCYTPEHQYTLRVKMNQPTCIPIQTCKGHMAFSPTKVVVEARNPKEAVKEAEKLMPNATNIRVIKHGEAVREEFRMRQAGEPQLPGFTDKELELKNKQ
jgi:hypothetical protein